MQATAGEGSGESVKSCLFKVELMYSRSYSDLLHVAEETRNREISALEKFTSNVVVVRVRASEVLEIKCR